MPILNRASELQSEATEWRHHLHANPEILYDVENTAAFVEARLRDFGVDEIVTGLGRTGVVGIIKGAGGEGRTIGLRADMDALPLDEISGKPWASTIAGRMHACGHDGHTAMLLGAAKYLAETRNFSGRVAVVFQPAEEGGRGALAMVEDGMMDRFGIEEIYGMHNMPGMPVGTFAIRKGGIMAAPDKFSLKITGRGGHAAEPHHAIDTIVIGSQIVGALQTIASRNANPLRSWSSPSPSSTPERPTTSSPKKPLFPVPCGLWTNRCGIWPSAASANWQPALPQPMGPWWNSTTSAPAP